MKVNIDVESRYLSLILKIIKQYAPDCEVWAFGSRVKWTAIEDSDLDLAIIAKNNAIIDYQQIYQLKDAFSESELPFSVDVVDFNKASTTFQEIIQQKYVVIYTPFQQNKLKLRFKADDGSEYPAWEEKKLGEIAKICTGNSNKIDTVVDGKYIFFDRSEAIGRSNKYLFDTEAIIMPGEGLFIPKYFIGKFDLHQRAYAIIDFKEVIAKYLYYYIGIAKNYFLSQAVGSTVLSLRLPIFNNMIINIPSIPEQQKIANVLTCIDDSIQQQTAKLEQIELYKKALLQQMLI